MATDGPLLGRWESSDPPSLPVWRQSRETHAHFRFGGCHVIRPRGEVTPTRHTRETPRPMKDVPIMLIKPSAKMTPTGIQHAWATYGLAGLTSYAHTSGSAVVT